VVTSKSAKGSSPEPAIAFFSSPGKGETAPDAPIDISAKQVEQGTVALGWRPPGGSNPDFYQIG